MNYTELLRPAGDAEQPGFARATLRHYRDAMIKVNGEGGFSLPFKMHEISSDLRTDTNQQKRETRGNWMERYDTAKLDAMEPKHRQYLGRAARALTDRLHAGNHTDPLLTEDNVRIVLAAMDNAYNPASEEARIDRQTLAQAATALGIAKGWQDARALDKPQTIGVLRAFAESGRALAAAAGSPARLSQAS